MKIKRQMEEEHNPLKALENKAIDSKREIDIAEGLDEIRTANARMELVDTDAVLDEIHRKKEEEVQRRRVAANSVADEDEALIQELFNHKKDNIKRVGEEDEKLKVLSSTIFKPSVAKPISAARKSLGIVSKKL